MTKSSWSSVDMNLTSSSSFFSFVVYVRSMI
jgi:hypothetical protein